MIAGCWTRQMSSLIQQGSSYVLMTVNCNPKSQMAILTFILSTECIDFAKNWKGATSHHQKIHSVNGIPDVSNLAEFSTKETLS